MFTSKEDLSKRSKFSKYFINSDGTRTAQIGGNYHYKDENGTWQDINLNILIQPTATSYFQNTTNDIKTYFPRTANAGSISMKLEDGITFNWWQGTYMATVSNGQLLSKVSPQAVTGTVTGSKLTYPDLYPSISEEFVIQENGLENNIILHSLTQEMQSLPSGSSVQFGHFIPLQRGWIVRNEKGQIMKNDFSSSTFSIQMNGEEKQLYFGQNIIFDNGITKDDALLINIPTEKLTDAQRLAIANNVLVVPHSIQFVRGGIEVRVNVPSQWLQNSARQFPVTIDPTVTITPAASTSGFYGPLTHWWGYQRHASLYLQSEIGAFGIINSLEYNSTTAGAGGAAPTEIYLKSITSATLTNNNWNSVDYTNGAHLGFNQSSDQGATLGWKLLTLTDPFRYETGNLLIMLSDKYGGSGNVKYYNQSASIPNRQLYNRVDGTDPGDGAYMTLEDNRLTEIRINYIPLNDCEGVPATVNINSVLGSVCPDVPFVINSDLTLESGLTLQWQSSTDDTNWTNLGIANQDVNFTYSVGQSEESSYRVIVRCSFTADEVISNEVQIGMIDYELCYCTNAIPFNCTDGDILTYVGFEEINNTTTCGTNGYSDYRTSQPTANVTIGNTYPLSATVGNGWDYESVSVWIDFNHNGRLDSLEGEHFIIGTGRNTTLTNNITIPATALGGLTRMRVVLTASLFPLNAFACGPSSANENYGEMEDYSVFIHVPLDSIEVATVGNIPAEINNYLGTLPIQATVYPLNAVQDVTWSIVPEMGTASISTDGIVSAITAGTVWAKAVSTSDLTKKDSVLITITNQIAPIDSVVVATVGNIPAAIDIPAGTLAHVATIYPTHANQDVTWTITHETGTGSIDTDGIVTAGVSGYVWAKATSVQDVTKHDSIRITITNHDLGVSSTGGAHLSIYPNPSKDFVQIKMAESHSALTLTLMDLNGKILLEEKIRENQLNSDYTIDIKKYPQGVYILKLNGSTI